MASYSSDDIFIVTGASSGIGKALALKLNKEGASVVGIGRSIEKLENVRQESEYPELFHVEQRDLAVDVDNLPQYITSLKVKYGKFKGLACVAGEANIATTQMLSQQLIGRIFLINYTVPMLLTKGFIDKRNNIGAGAGILYIASDAGVHPDKGLVVYGASKAALINSAISISKELAGRKIRCNCISPAWVNTPMYAQQNENFGLDLSNYALGLGSADDVAALGVFLLSDAAGWISGENYTMGTLKC